jgi:nitric oxide reductase NorD protein
VADTSEASELERRLEALVYRVLNARRSVAPAALELARFPSESRERFLASVALIARTSVELAYSFAIFAPASLARVDAEDWDEWVLHLMDRYDQSGVMACIVAMRGVDDYVAARRASRGALRLAEVARVIEHFVCGLGGRPLRLAAGETTFTDTETLFLPEQVRYSARREENYRLYKALAVHLWAQTWFGTWRAGVRQTVAGYPSPQRALRLFHALETARLDAHLARELPGVYREMRSLVPDDPAAGAPSPWREALARLGEAGADVAVTHSLLPWAYAHGWTPGPLVYQGTLLPERTEEAMALRQAREREALRRALAELLAQPPRDAAGRRSPPAAERLEAVRVAAAERPEGFRTELRLDGDPVPPPGDLQPTLDSIVQDFGLVPAEYLVAAGHGGYRAAGAARDADAGAVDPGEGSLLYDEWDHVRQSYRKGWCVLRERDVHPTPDGFVEATLAKHGRLLKHLYRTFEALRGEDRVLKREPHGDDIDVDAVVESWVDRRAGHEGTDRLFRRRSREERDIAVLFMVDMSGSTKGWINDMERESLVLLCEALELLGDRYAIYGFSGFTHKRCELLRVKRFDETYGEQVRARISGIRPLDYTRMGVAIRHLTRLLAGVEARTRLLVTLSDGRPDDQDGYRGTYGIEDTRQALLEARNLGVHPYCITIDDEALEYLPHMFGPAHFTVVNQVEKLPFRISDIYRRITA